MSHDSEAAAATALAERVVRDPLPFLVSAGEMLAASLDYEQTLRCLVEIVVPTLADVCSVHLLDDDGRFRRIASAGHTEGPAGLGEELTDHAVDAGERDGPMHRLLASGASLLGSPVTDEHLDLIVGTKRRMQITRQVHLTSVLVVPLTARERPFGVLCMGTSLRPRFEQAHLHLAEEVGRRAALALDTARLYRAISQSRAAAERARQRTAFLAEASAALAGSLDIRTTLQTVVRLAVPTMAESCSVVLTDEDGSFRRVAVAHSDPERQQFIDQQSQIIPTHGGALHPMTIALSTGRPHVENGITDERRRTYASGEYLELLQRLDIRARLVVPLEARGRRFGGLILAMADRCRTFDEDDVALGVELAGRAALAIDNARLYQDVCRANERLADQLELSDAIVRNIADGIMVTDCGWNITYVNPVAEQLFGRPRNELIGRDAHEVVRGHDEAGTPLPLDECRIRDVLLSGWIVRLDDEAFVRADGVTFPVALSASPLSKDGQVVGAVTIFRDVSDVRRQREALERSEERLRRALNRLQRSVAALLGLHDVSKLLTSGSDLDALGRRVLEIAVRAARLQSAVLRRQSSTGRVRLWQRVGPDNLLRGGCGGRAVAQARAQTVASGQPGVVQARRGAHEDGELTCWLVPLIVKGDVIGVLEAFGEPRPDEELTLEILGSIALQAATALENARLYREVADSERALRRLVHQLMGAQEDERRRLTYEIHDGFAQMATGVQQLVEAYAHDFPSESETGRNRMDVTIGLARRTVAEVRRVLAGLRPTVLDDFGLARGLHAYAEGLVAENVTVTFAESLGPERLDSNVEIALFRLAQEALTNVRKHAQVGCAELRLHRDNGQIVLEVEDGGCGFDLAALQGCTRPGEHLGLLSMRERITQVGGSVEITSRCGEGTLVRAVVPISGPAERRTTRRRD